MQPLFRAFENFFKNWVATVPTVLVIAILLAMFHGLLAMHTKAEQTLGRLSEKFSFTIYLKINADPFETGNLITALENRPDVQKPVAFTSQEAAFELLQKNFSLDSSLLKKYRFSLPASLTIRPKTPEDIPRIEKYLNETWAQLLKDPLETKGKNVTAEMLGFLENIKRTTSRTLLFFILLFVIGGSVLIGSTLHVAFLSRKTEITIMKLVGARRNKIIMPYVLEGTIIGFLAGLLNMAVVIVFPIDTEAARFTANALLIEAGAAIFLSSGVSYVTILFHLKK